MGDEPRMAEGSPAGLAAEPASGPASRSRSGPLHILVCAPAYPAPELARGGVQLAVRAQVERLARRGHRVTVVAPYRLYLPLRRYAVKRREIPPEARVERQGAIQIFRPRHLHLPGLWRLVDPLAVAVALLGGALRSRSGPLAVVHAHWLHPHGFAAALVGRLLRRPVILTAHGSDVGRLIGNDAHAGYYRRAMLAAVRRAEAVVCVSRAIAERLAALGAPRERLIVIPNGIDLERFQPRDRNTCRAEIARTYGTSLVSTSSDSRLLLFAGDLVPVKQVDRLLRAVATLGKAQGASAFRLVIAGEGSERDRLRALAAELDLGDRVTFAGRRPHAEMPTWLAAADVAVLPSASEGLPLFILEALASGTPVVASRVGGVPECVEDGVTGILVDPVTVEGLAAGLARALARSWDRAALAAAARPFSWDVITGRLETLYNSLA